MRKAKNTRDQKVETYLVTALCEREQPRCDGELEWRGNELLTYPPSYPHVCNKCGITWNLGYQYPLYEYRPVEVTT